MRRKNEIEHRIGRDHKTKEKYKKSTKHVEEHHGGVVCFLKRAIMVN